MASTRHSFAMETDPPTDQLKWFATTRWSLVLCARDDSPDSREALEQLCRLYWYPVFTFARFRGNSREEAEDLTQGFFEQLLQRRSLRTISRVGGRFRSFLLVAFKNYAANQSARRRAQKRGGGQCHMSLDEPACLAVLDSTLGNEVSPDRVFDRAWALVVIDRVQGELRDEYRDMNRGDDFRKLIQFLPGELPGETQVEAARALGMGEGAFRMELLRFKRRLAERIRREVAETIGPDGDVDMEVRHLMQSFS